MSDDHLHVLLIDDDEDDYLATRELLSRVFPATVTVDWKPSFEAGMQAIDRDDHDVCLLDYRLGPHSGLELLRHAEERQIHAPVIMLTGVADRRVDSDALASGAADYLVKGEFGPAALERSIRYSMERKRNEQELERSNALLRATERELRSRIEREALLNRIAFMLRSSLDPEEIQAAATAAIGEAIDVDRSYFGHLDATAGIVSLCAEWRRSGFPAIAGEYPISQSRMSHIVDAHRDLRSLVIDDLSSAGDDAISVVPSRRPAALVRVPISSNGHLSAFLCIEMADRPRSWTADEVALVETVAALSRGAIAMANIHQRELNIATTLQRNLLPPAYYKVPGLDIGIYYKPAMSEANVGGDFCDVFSLSDDIYALVVGDISGKGLLAASQVATIRDMLRCALYLENSLIDAVNKLNGILTRHNLISGFATLFVGIYSVRTHELTFVSCNLEPMLILRSETGMVEEIGPSGPPVSITDELTYGESKSTLAEGDVLLLFTDGLSEAGPDRGHMLFTEGVTRLLIEQHAPNVKAQSLVVNVAEAALQYANGTLHDDVCILAAMPRTESADVPTGA